MQIVSSMRAAQIAYHASNSALKIALVHLQLLQLCDLAPQFLELFHKFLIGDHHVLLVLHVAV